MRPGHDRVRERPGAILGEVEHRPYPLPTATWIQRQSWLDFLFLHWPVPVDVLRPLVPAELELETWDDRAWLGIIPFHMRGVTLRLCPDVPGLSAFPELNVRTYVRSGGRSGVYFLSLDATSAFAVAAARAWYLLPYFRADMSWRWEGDRMEYRSVRTHRSAPAAAMELDYRPIGAPRLALPGTFDHWLTERYALFVVDGGRVLRGDVHHRPWPLYDVEVDVRRNTMGEAHGIGLVEPTKPVHARWSTGVDTVIWRLSDR